MKEWILSVSVTVLICGLIFLILPKSKVSKAIKTVASFVTVFAVIQPLVGLDVSDLISESVFGRGEIVVQEEYLDYTGRLRESILRKRIVDNLEKTGIKLNEENIYIISDCLSEKGFFVEGAEINLKNAVIITENEHIDIKEEVKTVACEVLGVTSDRVKIYER